MVLYKIFSHPLMKSYKAGIFSKAAIFQLITYILMIVCPLLVAYRSQGFWVKTSTYHEQPNVQFKYQYLLHVHGKELEDYFIWSSFPALNYLEQDHLRVAYVEAHDTDINRDGQADRFQFSATVPMNNADSVHSVKLFLIFNYSLKKYSRFQQEALIFLDFQSITQSTELKVVGDMKLAQKYPLRYQGVDQRFNKPIVNGSTLNADGLLYSTILSRYFERDVITKLEPSNAYWTHGPAGVVGEFKIKVDINYVEDTIEYKTGFWELIKWAWIQYLAILLVFIFVFERIRSFVFQNRLVFAVPSYDSIPQPNARTMG